MSLNAALEKEYIVFLLADRLVNIVKDKGFS